MLQRDKRRWATADIDGDGELSKEEFTSFVHPEDSDHMKDIIIDVCFNLFPVFIAYNVHFHPLLLVLVVLFYCWGATGR